jgi:hypothetical protein
MPNMGFPPPGVPAFAANQVPQSQVMYATPTRRSRQSRQTRRHERVSAEFKCWNMAEMASSGSNWKKFIILFFKKTMKALRMWLWKEVKSEQHPFSVVVLSCFSFLCSMHSRGCVEISVRLSLNPSNDPKLSNYPEFDIHSRLSLWRSFSQTYNF